MSRLRDGASQLRWTGFSCGDAGVLQPSGESESGPRKTEETRQVGTDNAAVSLTCARTRMDAVGRVHRSGIKSAPLRSPGENETDKRARSDSFLFSPPKRPLIAVIGRSRQGKNAPSDALTAERCVPADGRGRSGQDGASSSCQKARKTPDVELFCLHNKSTQFCFAFPTLSSAEVVHYE